MEYKRLTNEELTDFTSRVVVQLEPTLTQQVMSLILELTEYRTKIENKTLIELHCKVGDTVYQFDNSGRIYEATILNIEIHKGKPYYETCGVDFDNTAIGETLFLTKDQAEQRLKELQNER